MNVNRISQVGVEMNPLNDHSEKTITLDDIHKILVEFQRIYSIESNRDTVIQSDANYIDDFMDRYIYSNIPLCGQYLQAKAKNSNIRRLIKGDVKSSEIDPMVNTFALVFALFLTISPNYLFNFSDGTTFSYLQDNIAVCNIDGTDDYWYKLVYIPISNMTLCSATVNIFGLGLVCCYYILRPSGVNHFQSWFREGGILFLISIVFLFAVSIISSLLPIVYYGFWLDVASGDLCNQVEMIKDHGAYALVSRNRNVLIIIGIITIPPLFVLYKMI